MSIKIFAIDLDGVLCVDGRPNMEVIQKINYLFERGHGIMIYTARMWQKYGATKRWLVDNLVRHNELIMGKPFATHYIDDHNCSVDEFLELEV